MGCLKITLLIIFAVVQILVLALSISAIVLPEWLDPEKYLTYTIIDEKVHFAKDVGLWQICTVGTGINQQTAENAYLNGINQYTTEYSYLIGYQSEEVGSDECKTGNMVEDFYREKFIFGEDVYGEFMVTRAMVILFVIFAIVKFFMVLAAKCRQEGGWCSLVIAIVIAILEAGSAAGALIAYGLILYKFAGEDVGIREFWGLSYQMFLAASVIAVVADFGFCICC